MKCDYCGVEMIQRRASDSEPYMYALSGLKNVGLVNIIVHRCPTCGFEAPIIPRVGELHRVIALDLVKQPRPLRGEEIRFLRKYTGLPARQFARLLGVTAPHLSRIENGHTQSFGASTDRLIRAIILTATDGKDARDILLKIADELEPRAKRKPQTQQLPLFTLRGSRWLKAA